MPVILDLTGQGISITQQSSSTMFFDMAGDGYKHRTAWAGVGNGVLAIDANGDGEITERNEVIFTDWDPTAGGDLQALRNVFDTNGNGKLDAGDARWAQFRVMVTNADGTTTLKTLDELGIQSIDLIADKSSVTLPDGSQIRGQTTYTRTDGTTGTAADVSLTYDAQGHAVERTVTRHADGSTTILNRMLNPDGALASAITGVTSADGKSVTLSFDRDGDTVIDDVQTRVTVANADGSKTETLSNVTAAGRLLDRTITHTSADGKITTITRDANGDGIADQTETRTKQADGTTTIVITDLSRDGTLVRQAATAVAADGQTRTVGVDLDGNATADDRETDATVVQGDGSRVQTISLRNADGTLRTQTVKTTSSDGRTQTVQSDLDGDGAADLVQSIVVTQGAGGSSTSASTRRSRDGTLIGSETATTSADGLIKQVKSDVTGDGVVDRTVTDTTVVQGDGSRLQTVETRHGDGSLASRSVVHKGADGRSRTTQVDADGDGTLDRTEVIAVDAAGASVATVSTYNDDGSLASKLVATTSATGLSRTTQADVNGDGVFDTTASEVTVRNTDGSATTTRTTTNTDGSLRTKVIESASANGLSKTAQVDLDGNGVIDRTTTDVTVLAADGTKTRTVTETNGNGSLKAKDIIVTSADRQTTTLTRDWNGDGAADESVTTVTQANGSVVETTVHRAANGSLIDRTVATTSATGLAKTVQVDLNGDGVIDLTSSTVTVLNADGSRTTTSTDSNGNGSLRTKTVATVSGNGLAKTVQEDLDGNGTVDRTTSEVTVLNADGSRTTTRTRTSANGTTLERTLIAASATGLALVISQDVNGDGTVDLVTTDTTVLNADGSGSRTVVEANADGSVRAKNVITTSADGKTTTSSADTDGDGHADRVTSVTTRANGDVVTTTTDLNASNEVLGRTVKTTSATGLSHKEEVDWNGDGVFDLTTAEVTVLSANGGRTTTSRHLNANGSERDKTVTTVNATGLSRTTQVDADGNGTYDTTVTDVTVLNADGSRTQTVSVTNANGTLRRKDVVTTSDDGETVSITRDLNGDGKTDRTETRTVDATGSVVETRSNLTATGALVSKVVETTSANGLSWKFQQDLNGDGTFDRAQVRDTVLNADGSRTTTFTDKAFSGSGGSVATVKSSVVATVSDDGLSKSYAFEAAGPASSPTLFRRQATDVTVLNADGSRTQTVSTTRDGTLLDRETRTVSGNGLSSSAQLDVDGNGTIDRTRAKTIAADGAVTETGETRNHSGTLAQKYAVTRTADGKTIQRQLDTDGDNAFDRSHGTQVNADGSVTDTWANRTAMGALKDQVTLTKSGNGLLETVAIDANGDGAIDQTVKSVITLHQDGSRTATVERANGSGALLSRTATTTSDDGLTSTAAVDSNGDGAIDRTVSTTTVLGADGTKTTTTTSQYADATLHKKSVVTTSADGRTTTSTLDSDGDAKTDKVITTTVNVDETRTDVVQYYKKDGTLAASMTQTTSADGLTVKKQWSNGVVETKEVLAEQSGSYTWTYTQGTTTVSVAHAVSLNGVETWTSNEGGMVHTVTIDLDTKQALLELAQRIYGVVLNRQMTARESETLLKYINGSSLDANQLASDLLAGQEFAQKYGNQSNAQFCDQIHQSALDHGAMLGDLHRFLAALADGTLTRAGAVVALANAAENLVNGGEAAAEERAPGAEVFGPEHITDKSLALNVVARLYDVMLDRAPTASEATAHAQAIVAGTKTIGDVIQALLGSSEFATKNGASLSNAAFVTKMFLNAFGREPTGGEAQQWLAALDAGQIARADMILGIAGTPGENPANRIAGTAGDDTLVGQNGRDELTGGAWANQITARKGNDIILDGQGTDTIHYARGDGNDVIYASRQFIAATGGNPAQIVGGDRLSFGNLNRAEVSLHRANASGNPAGAWDDLVIRILATGETITIHDQFKSGIADGGGTREWGLSDIVFADGTLLTRDEIAGAATVTSTKETIAADGSRTVIEWDAAAAAWSSIRREYNSAGLLTLERTVADDGTATAIIYDRIGSQTWATQQEWLDTQGRRAKLVTKNDDGSRLENLWDITNTQSWSAQTDTFNGAGQKTNQETRYDDSTLSLQLWDVANAQNWSTYTNFLNAAGQQTKQTGTYDNGTTWTSFWDVASANNWSSYTDYFDAAGRRTGQSGTYDNGQKWSIAWDVAGAYSWSYYTDYLNSSGVRTSQNGVYDSGSTWWGYWDVNGVNSWSSYYDYYDTAGRRTSQDIYYDSGTRTVQYWDAAGANSWSDYTNYYNASGQQTHQYGNYDNGYRWQTTFRTQWWESFAWVTDTLVNVGYRPSVYYLTERRSYYDSNNYFEEYWDALGQYSWSYIRYHVQSGFRYQEVIQYDDYNPDPREPGDGRGGEIQTEDDTQGAEYRVASTLGDDNLLGTSGADAFVFYGPFGNDVITGFQGGEGRGDILEFDDAVFASVQEVLAAARQDGADVLIDAGQRGSITLANMKIDSLHADDFRFV